MKFLALQCFSCRAMQVKQPKKNSNKWTCSICNEKQSLRKVFFSSDAAKDVRIIVQQANMGRGLTEEASAAERLSSDAKENSPDCRNAERDYLRPPQQPSHSKWERFLPEDELSVSDEENDPIDSNYVTSVPDTKLRNSRPKSVQSSKRANHLRNKEELAPQACEDLGFGVGDEEVREDVETAEMKCGNFETGVGGLKNVEAKGRSRKLLHPSRSSELGAASKETGEGLAKRDYAALSQGSGRYEGSKVFKTEVPQCPPSKWSKYLDVEDG